MGNAAVTKAARKAARVATAAAQDELARRTRANMDDLARFFPARGREEAVADWLVEKVAGLREQAQARRGEQRRACGAALGAMRDRGESVAEIARMAGVSENTVRELIRAATPSATGQPVAAEPQPAAGGTPALTEPGAAEPPGEPAAGGGAGARAQDGPGQR